MGLGFRVPNPNPNPNPNPTPNPDQVHRYKALLQKQRDIMIALTARLNERDEALLAMQETPNPEPWTLNSEPWTVDPEP